MTEALDIAVDVSDAQGIIDWPAVYASGIRVAMVKATEGATFVAASFDRNSVCAAKAGIAIIPYHFMRAVPIEAQVKHFEDTAGLGEDILCGLDWEGRASQTCPAADAERIGSLLQEITGRVPLGYWGIPGSTPAAPTLAMRKWERWVPRYPVTGVNSWRALPQATRANPEHWWKLDGSKGLPRFGQYTAWGRVAGIRGLVDRSVGFFASEAACLAWVNGKAMV